MRGGAVTRRAVDRNQELLGGRPRWRVGALTFARGICRGGGVSKVESGGPGEKNRWQRDMSS